MKTTEPHPGGDRRDRQRSAFTLVELLVAITVIGILVGLLAVGVQRAFSRAREFAIQTEMQQLEAAIEKFQIEYGFYPPSFRTMDLARFQTYLNRIAPNNAESQVDPANTNMSRLETWWNNVGAALVVSANSQVTANIEANTPGADLVFWLSGLSKNKQYPLTYPAGGPLPAHDFFPGGDGVEREVFFELDRSRVVTNPNAGNLIATYLQPSGRGIPYLYRDAGINYLPSMPQDPNSADGAYVNLTWIDPADGQEKMVGIQQIIDAAFHLTGDNSQTSSGLTPALSQNIFKQVYPNPESFQLVTFGLDGLPGGPQNAPNPNYFTATGPQGADNMVNFGTGGVGRLDSVIIEQN